MDEKHRRCEQRHVLAARAHRAAADQDELGNPEGAIYYAIEAAWHSGRASTMALQASTEWEEAELSKIPCWLMRGSFSAKHRCAANLHDSAAFAHALVRHCGGFQCSRHALEHSAGAHRQTQALAPASSSFLEHTEIVELAHQMWQARGCPEGSPQQDWFDAAAQIRARLSAGAG
jgi:hypothetical protein